MALDQIIPSIAGIRPGSAADAACAARARIMELSEAAHQAVLTPREPGGIAHAERAALAERMARHHDDAELAAHYAELLARTGAEAETAELRDPALVPAEARRAAMARHVDLLTLSPKAATRGSIEALKAAGLAEADIVRLSELAAFVSYQARLVAGLRLLKGAA